MASSKSASPVLDYIRKVASGWQAAARSDAELLEHFVGRRDEAAFALLVRRHGPMVRQLCLRILQNEQDADDAFQATFLVLCRKAASLDRKQSLGGWLHGVAYRVAQKARIDSARRRKHERRTPAPRVTDALAEISLREAHAILDDELARLPDKFRVPLVLCYLEGLARDQAARELGWSASTFKSRLEQARERLGKRLASRGVGLAGALVASLFYEARASAAVPAFCLDSTIEAATSVGVGGVTASAVSPKVAALTESVLKAMFMTKLKVTAAVLLLAVFIGGGAGINALSPGALAARQSNVGAAAQGDRPPVDSLKTAPGKDADKPKSDNDRLQGTWEFVAATQGGKTKKLQDFGEEDGRPKSLKFTGDKLLAVMVNSGGKEVEFQYGFELDPSQKPKKIDLIADGEPKGVSGPGVYELEGDSLRVCFPGQPDQERPTKLESKEGENYLLLTYKRVGKDLPKGADPADAKAKGDIRGNVDGPELALRLDGQALKGGPRVTVDGPEVPLHLDGQAIKGSANEAGVQGDNVLLEQVRKWAWQVDSVDSGKGTIKLRRVSSPAFFTLEMTVSPDAKISIDGRQKTLADVQSMTQITFQTAKDAPIIIRIDGSTAEAVLKGVDIDRKSLRVIVGGEEWTAPLATGARVILRGQHAQLADLKPGMLFGHVELGVEAGQLVVKHINTGGQIVGAAR
jgi:RNA polymerase sigma factor (sigma-70 family)